MVKGTSSQPARDPIRTRKQSANQQRRNSVSDIKDFFQSKSVDATKNSNTMSTKKDKEKDKERAKEAREARENIKAMLLRDDIASKENTTSENNNANGDNMIKEKDTEIAHAEPQAMTEHGEETLNLSSTVATQTSEDAILSALKELAEKYDKLENTIEEPKLGLSAQLAKTQNTVSQLYTDINGAVSGLKAQMANVTRIAENNTKNIEVLQNGQKQMATLLDENK